MKGHSMFIQFFMVKFNAKKRGGKFPPMLQVRAGFIK